MCLDSSAIDIKLVIAFVLYRCFIPGISCLQEHPKGAHCGPEHVVPKCKAVPNITSRWQQRGLQLGHISSHTWWRTFDVQIFTCRINIAVCCSVCLGRFSLFFCACVEGVLSTERTLQNINITIITILTAKAFFFFKTLLSIKAGSKHFKIFQHNHPLEM